MSPNPVKSEIIYKSGTLTEKNLTVYSYDCIDSTNTQAKRIYESGLHSDFLVLAEEQTAGRGRLGRSFFSPKGSGLYMSLLLNVENSDLDNLSLTAAAAVAVSTSVEKLTGIKTGIKWVNDIYKDNKKLCGILAEAVNHKDQSGISAVIIGIGINLTPSSFPDELTDIVTSLNVPSLDRNMLVYEICTRLLSYRDCPDNSALILEYKKRSIVLGKKIRFLKNNQEYFGKAIDIGDKGELIVLNESGLQETLSTGEITVRLI